MTTVETSVRDLVEFLMRSGSIDNRFGGFDRAQLGAQIHRKIQKEAGHHYEAEVYFQDITDFNGFTFIVRGRADGVITEGTDITIDEIKTTARDLDMLEADDRPVHWAQAKCYAWYLIKKQHLDFIHVRLTYCHIESRECRFFKKTYTYKQLESFYEELLLGYIKWAKMQSDWMNRRNQSAQTVNFPYPEYRKGQREMAVAVYNTIRNGGRLFCQAPTGVGKTLSTIFPAAKALGQDIIDKIFYLTAKTITRQVAEESMQHLRHHGLHIKTVTLTAKDKVCFLDERNCNPEACAYARDYFSKINDVVYEMLNAEEAFDRPIIETWAKKYDVCPFELALDLSQWCDVIIGDYNYLFDPIVALKRYFESGNGRYLFLVDEAHNLVDRSRSMYSASLKKSEFLELKRKLTKQDKPLYTATEKVNKAFIDLRKHCGDDHLLVEQPALETLNEALTIWGYSYESFSKKNAGNPILEEILELYFGVRTYLGITELYDEGYVTSIRHSGSEVWTTQHCLDPSKKLSNILQCGQASILFSATLSPMDYYLQVLGADEETRKCQFPSPFDRQNLCLCIANSISTRYVDREASCEAIVSMIHTMIAGRKGNYMVFFPSYAYMELIASHFTLSDNNSTLIVQHTDMDESSREAFLNQFNDNKDGKQTLVGFCVMGGIFGEGIDLKGDRLIGAAIVGVGLPQIGWERDILRDYYDAKSGSGFDYAYRNPGMNKVLQSIGRVIRSQEDRGVVLLIDERFAYGSYQQLMPPHLHHPMYIRTSEELKNVIEAFWN